MGRHAVEESGIEFIDNGTAPEFFINKLHDVEVMGSVCRFVPVVYRRTPAGILYKEPVFTAIMPIGDVGDAVALTLEKTGIAIALPAATGALRHLLRSFAVH